MRQPWEESTGVAVCVVHHDNPFVLSITQPSKRAGGKARSVRVRERLEPEPKLPSLRLAEAVDERLRLRGCQEPRRSESRCIGDLARDRAFAGAGVSEQHYGVLLFPER